VRPKLQQRVEQLGLSIALSAVASHQRDVLATLDSRADEFPLKGAHLALQEYGVPSRALVKTLKTRGAEVTRVPVYHWALPDEIGPL
jgi:uroporphyrinogen-III synthase